MSSGKKNKDQWKYLGHIPTKIVGLQYYGNLRPAFGEVILFEPEPGNPVDANALVACGQKGKKIGYLPRYDARILAPAIREGVIMIKGIVDDDEGTFAASKSFPSGSGRSARERGASSETCGDWGQTSCIELAPRNLHTSSSGQNHCIWIRLELYGTTKSKKWFRRMPPRSPRDILHNMLLELWRNADELPAETIRQTRDFYRQKVHGGDVHPHTAIVYRLLRGKMYEREQAEFDEYRAAIDEYLECVLIRPGKIQGSGSFLVVPLFFAGDEEEGILFADLRQLAENCMQNSGKPEDCEELVRCHSYPDGAIGVVFLQNGNLLSLHFYDSAAELEIKWFQLVMQNLNAEPRREIPFGDFLPDLRTKLQQAKLEVVPASDGLEKVKLYAEVEGTVFFDDGELCMLTLRNHSDDNRKRVVSLEEKGVRS